MAYDYYKDIENIYNAKVGYNNATTDEERKKHNDVANAARKQLTAYGYGDIAEQLSATGADATAARKIMEQYAPTPVAAPNSLTMSDKELQTTHNNEIRNKTNQLWGIQTDDRQMMTDKYGKLEDTAYSNPFNTDEAKAIIGKYDLAGMNARDNAVASGGASNGGNIDSYAAANAMRQQAALVNQGQMAVLDAHNNKINNVKGILSDLGVYLQNQDKGMQNTIQQQQNESQRLFENGETAKNNEVARLSEQASVTGYTPTEWTIKNDAVYSQFLNPDGTFKKEMEGTDIQALINATTDPETKKKLAVVRAKKMLGNYEEYGKYMNEGDVAFMSPQITEARRESEQNNATVLKTLDQNSADTRYVADANNQNALDQIDANASAQQKILETSQQTGLTFDKNGNVVQNENTKAQTDNWTTFKNYFSDENIVNFLDKKLKPYFDTGAGLDQAELEKLIIGDDVLNSNSTTYDIDVEEAREIIKQLNIILKATNPNAEPYSDEFLDSYTNRTWFNKGKGMKLK